MDNLDRTNVGQAAIAKWTLNLQLKAVGILLENDDVDNHEELGAYLRESESRLVRGLRCVLLMRFFSLRGSVV